MTIRQVGGLLSCRPLDPRIMTGLHLRIVLGCVLDPTYQWQGLMAATIASAALQLM